jgi:hypothetical protein
MDEKFGSDQVDLVEVVEQCGLRSDPKELIQLLMKRCRVASL